MLIDIAVVYTLNITLHNSPPTFPPRMHPPTSLMEHAKLPPFRPNKRDLRSTGSILRHRSTYV